MLLLRPSARFFGEGLAAGTPGLDPHQEGARGCNPRFGGGGYLLRRRRSVRGWFGGSHGPPQRRAEDVWLPVKTELRLRSSRRWRRLCVVTLVKASPF